MLYETVEKIPSVMGGGAVPHPKRDEIFLMLQSTQINEIRKITQDTITALYPNTPSYKSAMGNVKSMIKQCAKLVKTTVGYDYKIVQRNNDIYVQRIH